MDDGYRLQLTKKITDRHTSEAAGRGGIGTRNVHDFSLVYHKTPSKETYFNKKSKLY